jgi:hypothetical protein
MIKKKSLIRKATRPMQSIEMMAPSEFTIRPRFIPNSYEDSPIEEIRKFKGLEENPREAAASVRPASPPTLEIKEPDIDREKIKRITEKLNLLKQQRAEEEKRKQEEMKKIGEENRLKEEVRLEEARREKAKLQEINFKKPIPPPISAPPARAHLAIPPPASKPATKIFPPKALPINTKPATAPQKNSLFFRPKPKVASEEEIEKKKKLLDSEKITDIPELPEEE